jgi:hypothetical protein
MTIQTLVTPGRGILMTTVSSGMTPSEISVTTAP